MGKITVAIGSESYLKRTFLSYCLRNFHREKIWLIDSLQIFDLYFLSRHHIQNTRELIRNLRVFRPFNFHQLRDKLFRLTEIKLSKKSTIIVTSLEYLTKEIENEDEKKEITKDTINLLKKLYDYHDCKILIGSSDDSLARNIIDVLHDVRIFEERFEFEKRFTRSSSDIERESIT